MFAGQFWDAAQWEEDQNVLILLDAPDLTADDLLPYLEGLRDRVDQVYVAAQQPQKAIWLTAQPLLILRD